MSSSLRSTLAAVAAVTTLGLLTVVPSASAATPAPGPAAAPAANVIVIPSADEVSTTLDASRCPWMRTYITALTSTVGSRSMAVLLAAPLVGAEFGQDGN